MSTDRHAEPPRERIRCRKTGHEHEVLGRSAEVVSTGSLPSGFRVVAYRSMLTDRVRVTPESEFDSLFEPVEPKKPFARNQLRVLPGGKGSEPNVPLHLVTQGGQPLGSVRRCCERCGRMCWPGRKGTAERWTDDPEEFAASPIRCDMIGTDYGYGASSE